MEREGSNHVLPDLAKLSLEKGRALDVEDLDDDGWRAASETKKIIELGSLGEGAGGAVTRCKLEGGKTEFALKVIYWHTSPYLAQLKCLRSSPRIPIQTSKSRSNVNWRSTKNAPLSTFASTMAPLMIPAALYPSLWSIARVAALIASTEK